MDKYKNKDLDKDIFSYADKDKNSDTFEEYLDEKYKPKSEIFLGGFLGVFKKIFKKEDNVKKEDKFVKEYNFKKEDGADSFGEECGTGEIYTEFWENKYKEVVFTKEYIDEVYGNQEIEGLTEFSSYGEDFYGLDTDYLYLCVTKKIKNVPLPSYAKTQKTKKYSRDKKTWIKEYKKYLQSCYEKYSKFEVTMSDIEEVTKFELPNSENLNNDDYFLLLKNRIQEFNEKSDIEKKILTTCYDWELMPLGNYIVSRECLKSYNIKDFLSLIITKLPYQLKQIGSYIVYFDETNDIYDITMEFLKDKDTENKTYISDENLVKHMDISTFQFDVRNSDYKITGEDVLKVTPLINELIFYGDKLFKHDTFHLNTAIDHIHNCENVEDLIKIMRAKYLIVF